MHKNVLQDMESLQADILLKSNEFFAALNNLRYEGKAGLKRNMRTISRLNHCFRKELLPHFQADEQVVFPYVESHFPKYSPLLSFLKAEHEEIKNNFDDLDGMVSEIALGKNKPLRQGQVDRIYDRGTYIYCLIRNHIQMESEVIYRGIQKNLHPSEKKELGILNLADNLFRQRLVVYDIAHVVFLAGFLAIVVESDVDEDLLTVLPFPVVDAKDGTDVEVGNLDFGHCFCLSVMRSVEAADLRPLRCA